MGALKARELDEIGGNPMETSWEIHDFELRSNVKQLLLEAGRRLQTVHTAGRSGDELGLASES